MSLDSLPADVRAPTFFKLDIEGFELQALRGGQAWLSTHLPTYVWMETIPSLAEASTGSKTAWMDAISFWFDLGYQAWIPGAGNVEVTRAMLEEERLGGTKIAKALEPCSNNIVLSQLPLKDFAVPIPLDVCMAYGARGH